LIVVVLVVLLTSSCFPLIDVVVAVADTRVVIDAKIIVSVKIVAAVIVVARRVLFRRDFF
jgi:hypothetical protein